MLNKHVVVQSVVAIKNYFCASFVPKNSSEMAARRQFALVIVALLAVEAFSASVLKRRAATEAPEPSNTTPIETCQRNTPCGWAVYTRFTRVVDYFMKNKCECPEDKQCVRTDDDISVAAYVYRCRDTSNENSSNNS